MSLKDRLGQWLEGKTGRKLGTTTYHAPDLSERYFGFETPDGFHYTILQFPKEGGEQEVVDQASEEVLRFLAEKHGIVANTWDQLKNILGDSREALMTLAGTAGRDGLALATEVYGTADGCKTPILRILRVNPQTGEDLPDMICNRPVKWLNDGGTLPRDKSPRSRLNAGGIVNVFDRMEVK